MGGPLMKNILSFLGPFVFLLTLPSFGVEKSEISISWPGKYMGTNRNYLMTIKHLDQNTLSVEIKSLDVKPSSSDGSLIASFVASVSGNIAKFKELRDPQNCKVNLRRLPTGVFLEDLCGGTDGGVYLKQD